MSWLAHLGTYISLFLLPFFGMLGFHPTMAGMPVAMNSAETTSTQSQWSSVATTTMTWEDVDTQIGTTTLYVSLINPMYARNAENVYADDILILNADPATFVPLDGPGTLIPYSRDKNHVYITGYQTGITSVVDGADPATFRVLANFNFPDNTGEEGWAGAGIAVDATHVFNFGDVISGADPSTFKVLMAPNEKPSLYAEDGQHVYFNGDIVIDEADVGTFQATSQTTAQDKNHKYLNGQVVQGSTQAATTTVILDAQGNPSEYSKDSAHVYFDGSDNPSYSPTIVSNYPASFAALPFNDLYSDGHQVFQWGQTLSSDAAHFVSLRSLGVPHLLAKDSKYLYISSPQLAEVDAIPNSDPASFRFVMSGSATSTYAIDKNLVYYFGGYAPAYVLLQSLPLDPNTASPVPLKDGGTSNCAIKDASHVYLWDFNKVPNADPASFVITKSDCSTGQDKNGAYPNLQQYQQQEVG